jgi:hypothetical protein
MPVLKETYLQIQERNRREIRNRTKARVDQLAAEEIRNRTKAREEQFAGGKETDLATPVPLHSAPQAPDCHFVVIVLLLFAILLSQILLLFLRKEKEKSVQSGSDDDDIPFSQLRDKVREETPGSLTEKERPRQVEDNMIRSLSEKEADICVRLLREREANEAAILGEVLPRGVDGDAAQVSLSQFAESLEGSISEMQKPIEDISIEEVGTKVAKDFGALGMFSGTVLSVEYDSDDCMKAKPFYCVEYCDGDREDLNEEEFLYAKELCFQMELDAEDDVDDISVASDNDEDNSQLPSTKVTKLPSELFPSHRGGLTPLYIHLPLFRKCVSVAGRKKLRDRTMTKTSLIVHHLR